MPKHRVLPPPGGAPCRLRPRTAQRRRQAAVQQEWQVAGGQAGVDDVALGAERLEEDRLQGGPGGDAQPHAPRAPAGSKTWVLHAAAAGRGGQSTGPGSSRGRWAAGKGPAAQGRRAGGRSAASWLTVRVHPLAAAPPGSAGQCCPTGPGRPAACRRKTGMFGCWCWQLEAAKGLASRVPSQQRACHA